MRLVSVRVQNFQSFNDSGEIVFADAINLVIGQNNAGKSAFLRALLPALPDDRHRTPDRWEDHRLPLPKVQFVIEVSGTELEDWLLRSGGNPCIPMPIGSDPVEYVNNILAESAIRISVFHGPNSSFSSAYPSHGLFVAEEGAAACAVLSVRNGELGQSITRHSFDDNLTTLLWEAWSREMFYFAAERMTIGEALSGYASRLSQNASNLPNVLHALANERGDLFTKLIEHLREIFSTVGNLSVRTRPETNQLEIRVWPTEAMARVELSFPLNSSGTGVAQVIAILTAIMTLDRAVFIIDEINSFLHPAAVKNLLRIIQSEYNHHQYIISTHAPEVIGFGNPKTIHLAKRSGYESTLEALNLEEVGKLRGVADHLGVSMADVFAADRVIWVEGPTEELCFSYLYQQIHGPLPKGTVITSVAATGDFNTKRRDPEIVYQVYSRLVSASATLVVSVVFSFDSEKLSEEEKETMRRNSGGLLHFLPRRHFECYLIDPSAIAAFIISKDPGSSQTATPQAIEVAIQTAAGDRPFAIAEWRGDIRDPEWLARVDAANLIVAVCNNISEARAPFSKKDDSLFLVRHIIENNTSELTPLSEYVVSLVAAVSD